MKNKYLLLHVLIGLCLPVFVKAQEKKNTTEQKDAFSAMATYQSALHYFGRTDSLKSSGLFPTLGFESRTGLYAQGSFIFVNNSAQSNEYSGSTLEAGYRFPQTKHFSGNIFYSQFLYKDKSMLVQSALHAQTGLNLNYLNSILNVNTGVDLKFSDQTDLGLTIGFDHLFLIHQEGSGNALGINPSIYAYAGTQKFSNTYLEKKNFLGIPVTQQTTEKYTQLNILSYEISLPIVYVFGKCNASLIPAYTLPQNLLTVAGRPDLSEYGKNLFYVSLSLGIQL
ncbi:MAG: hypothetical protein KGO92_02680 [Bacteroidota bacterium]|nr:hypothetical protein [Bacteroidota bacterium]